MRLLGHSNCHIRTARDVHELGRPPSGSFSLSSQWPGAGESKPCSACLGAEKGMLCGRSVPAKLCGALGSWPGSRPQGRRWGRSVARAIQHRLALRMEPRDSTFAVASSAGQEACRPGSWKRGEGGRCTCCGGAGGREAPQPWGDSQDEGAGFLEPTEGLEKPTGVLTLPGQSFDGLDDLVMQIAEGGVGAGCGDREKTKLEQQARHLGVPSTVGTIPRPLEPKHAAGESARCLSHRH